MQNVAIPRHCTPRLQNRSDLRAAAAAAAAPPPPGEDSSRNSGAEENSAFENSNFALINAISVTVIMDQISG